MNYYSNGTIKRARNRFYRDLATKQAIKYLSMNAQKLRFYLLNKTRAFHYDLKRIAKDLKLSLYMIKKAINELKQHNYLRIAKKRDLKGRFYGYQFLIYEYRKDNKSQDLNEIIIINKDVNIIYSPKVEKESDKEKYIILYNENEAILKEILKRNLKKKPLDNDFLLNIDRFNYYGVEIETEQQLNRLKNLVNNSEYNKILRNKSILFNFLCFYQKEKINVVFKMLPYKTTKEIKRFKAIERAESRKKERAIKRAKIEQEKEQRREKGREAFKKFLNDLFINDLNEIKNTTIKKIKMQALYNTGSDKEPSAILNACKDYINAYATSEQKEQIKAIKSQLLLNGAK